MEGYSVKEPTLVILAAGMGSRFGGLKQITAVDEHGHAIIDFSLPVLLFLYPLTITLILLALTSRFWGGHRSVYRWVTGFTAAAGALDFLNALPEGVAAALHLHEILPPVTGLLPFFDAGFGWLCPALIGLLIGLWRSRSA